VRGNHDHAVGNPNEQMNVEARMAIEWTRGELGVAQRTFLSGLPYTIEDHDRLYVHADASDPQRWIYVQSVSEAATSLSATSAGISFCGHVHKPALYTMSATAKMTAFTPKTDVAIPVMPGRHWLAVLGSVGQPRDGNPAAAYLMLDTAKQEITFRRAPYDTEAAAAAIRKQGLPTSLAERLLVGR
jgi:diadenosine tetraphosphatase ApaH/serine/threonine PP2A family protein phosphatase